MRWEVDKGQTNCLPVPAHLVLVDYVQDLPFYHRRQQRCVSRQQRATLSVNPYCWLSGEDVIFNDFFKAYISAVMAAALS